MQFSARLIQVLEPVTGPSRNGGEWKRQDIIVETDGQYPKKVCVTIWGDRVNPSSLQVGSMLDISCDLESREFNGRWYTSVTAWRIEQGAQAPMPHAEEHAPVGMSQTAPPLSDAGEIPPSAPSDDADDLPF